ncbi:spindle apparatus coiled-coil protein 1 spindly isoform X2 [Ptiloglossa arizonensis]
MKDYENIILNLETKLTNQTIEIEKLRQHVNKDKKTESKVIIDELANISLEADNAHLKKRIDELAILLHEEKEKSNRAEETVNELKAQYNESQHIFMNIKEQLAEKSRALENAREELILKRTEEESLKLDPTQNLCKGNSLFAEVEDRRQNVVNKVNVLHEKYIEVKRICKTQTAEIKMLKAELVSSHKKWENNTDHTLAENDELIQKYKKRISDLESKLKFEIKRNHDTRELNSNDISFTYLQSLLDCKKKEANEFRIKIEDLSTQLLVQEETKTNIAEQLQRCQYEVSSLKAQVCSLQMELKLGFAHDAETELKQQPEKFNQPPLLTTFKTKNTCLLKDEADSKTIDQAKQNERLNEHAKDTNSDKNKSFKKIVRLAENVNTNENIASQKSSETYKYPIVHIS